MSWYQALGAVLGSTAVIGTATHAALVDQSILRQGLSTTNRGADGQLEPGVAATFAPFNPALGTLRAVELRTSFHAPNVSLQIQNLAARWAFILASTGFVFNHAVTSPAGGSPAATYLPGMFDGLTVNSFLAPWDGPDASSGPSLVHQSSVSTKFSHTLTADGVSAQLGDGPFAPRLWGAESGMLTPWIGTEPVTITTTVQPFAQFETAGTPLAITTPVAALYDMRLDLRYVYDPIPTPTALAGMAGLGLLAARRRR
jgi:hypothetical protein